jgi:hypothetical protein
MLQRHLAAIPFTQEDATGTRSAWTSWERIERTRWTSITRTIRALGAGPLTTRYHASFFAYVIDFIFATASLFYQGVARSRVNSCGSDQSRGLSVPSQNSGKQKYDRPGDPKNYFAHLNLPSVQPPFGLKLFLAQN